MMVPVGVLMALAGATALRADERLTLFSPAYGIDKVQFQTDNGSQYTLVQTSLAVDLVGLEGAYERFPWLTLGTTISARYDSAELNSLQVATNANGGSALLKSASYTVTSLAPCLVLGIHPFPKLDPLEPFVEAKLEVYQFSQNNLADPTVDRYRTQFSLGMRSQPNETGYFWGARITAGSRGYSGTLGGIDIPDPYVFGLQVDWIGLQL
jgi:hypothetical protein